MLVWDHTIRIWMQRVAVSGGKKWNYLDGDQFKTRNKKSKIDRKRAAFQEFEL